MAEKNPDNKGGGYGFRSKYLRGRWTPCLGAYDEDGGPWLQSRWRYTSDEHSRNDQLVFLYSVGIQVVLGTLNYFCFEVISCPKTCRVERI